MTAYKHICTVSASSLLALTITSCGSASPPSVRKSPTPFTTKPVSVATADHTTSEISGIIRLIGGKWPGHTFVPTQANIRISDAKKKVVKSINIESDHFKIALPVGSYEVSVHYNIDTCGYPQRVSIPSDTHLVLHFVCAMR